MRGTGRARAAARVGWVLPAAALALVAGAVPAMSSAASPPGRPVVDSPGSPWSWPLAAGRDVQRGYAAPATPYSAGHRGIDLPATAGAQVLAPAPGVVHFSGPVAGRPVLSIRHEGGLLSSFEPVESALAPGDPVASGMPVGRVGSGGHCGGGCLHVGLRLHGAYVSPLLYLGGAERAVLLPTRPLP